MAGAIMKRYFVWLILMGMLLPIATQAAPVDSLHFRPDSAATSVADRIGERPYSVDIVSVGIRAMLSLAGIIALIFVTILILKKIAIPQRSSGKFAQAVTVLGTVPIAQKKSIQLLKLVDRVLVVAITESSISLLTEIDDAHVLEALQPTSADKIEKPVPFKQYLTKMLGKSDAS
jgi:flagellar biogenesis protein FliO